MPLIKANTAPAQMTAFSMADIENAAKSMLLRARQRADQLLAAAQVEADIMKKAAHAEGFAQGKREGLEAGKTQGQTTGHQQALSESKAAMTQLMTALNAALRDVNEGRRRLQVEAVDDVVALACAIARRVTHRISPFDPQILATNLNEAMKLVVHASDVRIAVHPSQKKTLETELPRLQLAWPNLEHVELIEDATLAPGGCKLFTSDGHIDADLNTQLAKIMQELLPESRVAAMPASPAASSPAEKSDASAKIDPAGGNR